MRHLMKTKRTATGQNTTEIKINESSFLKNYFSWRFFKSLENILKAYISLKFSLYIIWSIHSSYGIKHFIVDTLQWKCHRTYVARRHENICFVHKVQCYFVFLFFMSNVNYYQYERYIYCKFSLFLLFDLYFIYYFLNDRLKKTKFVFVSSQRENWWKYIIRVNSAYSIELHILTTNNRMLSTVKNVIDDSVSFIRNALSHVVTP